MTTRNGRSTRNPLARAGGFKPSICHHYGRAKGTRSQERVDLSSSTPFATFSGTRTRSQERVDLSNGLLSEKLTARGTRSQERVDLSVDNSFIDMAQGEPARKSGWI